MRTLIAAAACVLLLSGCGIKGPLFLPPADTEPAEAQPSEVPSAEPIPPIRSFE